MLFLPFFRFHCHSLLLLGRVWICERVCVCLLYVLYVQTVYIYIVQRGREATMTVTRSTRVGLTPVMVAVVVMALMLGIDVGKSATVPSKCEGVKLPALHWPCSSSSFSGNSVHTAEFSSELFFCLMQAWMHFSAAAAAVSAKYSASTF